MSNAVVLSCVPYFLALYEIEPLTAKMCLCAGGGTAFYHFSRPPGVPTDNDNVML